MEYFEKMARMREELLSAENGELICNDFQRALPSLRSTELYGIFSRMPKGRLLHAHIEATFDLRYSIRMAIGSGLCYVYLAGDPAGHEYGQLAYGAWFEGGVIPEGWVAVSEALKSHPDLENEIYRLCTTTTSDIDENIWPKFEAIFNRYRAINNYLPHFKKLYSKVFADMAREGLTGVDFRFIGQTIFDESGRRLEPDCYVDTVQEIAAGVREQFPGFNVRLIYSYYKGVAAESVPERAAYARHLREKYPDICIGFDMVGQEDCGKSLEYYRSALESAGVPVIMHAGESTLQSNSNVTTAAEMGLARIGHGTNLYMHPSAYSLFKERGTLMEVCPISNQLLGYTPDLSKHPAAGYLRSGLNVTINSDDCAIFGTSYLSDDLLAAYLCWDLSIEQLQQAIENSLEGDAQQIAALRRNWDEFIRTVWP